MSSLYDDQKTSGWGLLPAQALALLRKREWENTSHLKALLTGERNFPISISLKPPSGPQALANLEHFQNFCESWRLYPQQAQVLYKSRSYRTLEQQRIPTKLEIDSVQSLVSVLGDDALRRYEHWSRVIAPILEAPMAKALEQELYRALIANLSLLDRLSAEQSYNIAGLLPQLTKNAGQGLYLRALPVRGIDTKFIEEQQVLLQTLLDVIFSGAITDAGGLIPWLGCIPIPKGWLCIKPLSNRVAREIGGFPVMQLPLDVLQRNALPAQRILIVENLSSGLALPSQPDTVAVIGTGRNLQWLSASWLADKQVAYWGDIDTWGLTMLSDARVHCPHISALMMDLPTVLSHQERMVAEPEPAPYMPLMLTEAERRLYSDLLSGRFEQGRLEQERLSQDYVLRGLERWR